MAERDNRWRVIEINVVHRNRWVGEHIQREGAESDFFMLEFTDTMILGPFLWTILY